MFLQASRLNHFICAAVVVVALTFLGATNVLAQIYVQTNLVSDIPGRAPHTDPLLVNPWGLARSGSSPWWVADNETGVSTIYNGAGVASQNPPGVQFVVNIPTAPSGSGNASPTGIVFNSSSDMTDFHGARFLFATEDGTISAWIPSIDQFNAILQVNHSSTAIYKGLTMSSFNGASYLYAADFHSGVVEVFDKNFAKAPFHQRHSRTPVFRTDMGPSTCRQSETRSS